MTYADLTAALAVLGLSQRASLAEIKKRHRQLVKRHHPDADSGSEPETIRRINAAYALLRDYCASYCYSFTKEEFLLQNPEERLRQQFAWDPVWGGKTEEEN